MKRMCKSGKRTINRYLTMVLALILLSTTVLAGCGKETAEDTNVVSENIRESESVSAPEKESESKEKEEVAEKPEETVPEEKETATEVEVVEVSDTEDEVAAYVKSGNGLVNGNFADGLGGYEVYSFLEDNISYTTDSQDGFTMEIADTGDEAWHVQLKQAGIALTKGSWYRLSMKAKASRNRVITCTMQRDGSADDVWTAYSPESRLELTKSWKTYTVLFQMQDETDKNAIFNLSMGTVDGKRITKNHSVSVTGIKLEKLDDNWIDATRKDGNLIANGDFSYGNVMWEASVVDPAKSDVSFDNNKVTFDMKSVGDLDWHLQLKQSGIKVTDNQGYFISFKATSNVYRYIKIGVMDQNYVNWYGGGDVYLIGDGEEHTYGVSIYNQISWDDNAQIMISMGKIEGLGSAAGKVELYDFNMTKSAYVPYYGQTTIAGSKPMGPQHVELNTQMLASTDFSAGSSWDYYFAEAAAVSQEIVGGKTVLKITNPGVNDYDVQYKQSGLTLEKGCTYEFELDAVSSPARMIKVGFLRENPAVAGGWEWFGGGDISLTEDTSLSAKNVLGKVLGTVCTAVAPGKYSDELFSVAAKTSTKHKISFTMTGETIYDGVMTISMGKIDDTTPVTSTITLSSCSLKKVEEATAEKPEEKLPEGVFARVNASDKKVSDEYGEKWVVKIEAPVYDVSKFEHKTVKITGDLESDGTFSALLGACYYAPGNEWSWVDSGTKEGSKVSFSVVVKDFHGGAQFQIMSMTGTYVDVKNLKVEEYVEEEKPEDSGEKLPEGVFARVNATDQKVSDEYGEKWVVKIEAPVYDVSKFEHKTVKITGDLESDGTFSALLGACYYAPGNDWAWVDSGTKEGSKASFSVVAKDFHGGAQFQIMSMTGTYVDVKNLKVEEYVEEEKPEDSGETDNTKPESDPDNMLQNGIFDGNTGWSTYVHAPDGAAADFSFTNYAVKVDIANLGVSDWNVQLKQAGLTFEQNAKYDVKFDIVSTVDRTVKLALMSGESDWYGGDDIVLKANESRTYTQTFTIEKANTTQGALQFSMGNIEGKETPTGTITIKNVVLKKVVEATPGESENPGETEQPEESEENKKPETDPNNMLQNGIFDGNTGWSTYVHAPDGAAADFSFTNYAVKVDITNLGVSDWNVQLKQAGLTFEQNAIYDIKFDIVSTVDRTVKLALMDSTNKWCCGDDIILRANEMESYSKKLIFSAATITQGVLQLSMGKVGDETSTGSITIKNVVMKKVVADPNEPQATSPEKLEDGTIRFHSTDAKNAQGQIIYNLDFSSISEPVGKKIKVTATMESDGNFTGQIGGCTTQTPVWVGDYKADIKKADFDVTFDTYTDAGQIQISNMTGTYVDVKNIKYEELGTSSNPDPTPEPEPLNSVISNGNFTNNGEGWQISGKTVDTSVAYNNGAAVINVANAGPNPWSVQLQQTDVKIIQKGKYVLTFTAKADKEKKIGMGLTGGPSSYTSYYGKEFTLTTEEKEYTDYFVVTGDPSQDTISFQMNLGKVGEIAETDSAEVTIKNVKLTLLGEVILGNDTLNVGNEIFINSAATGTANFENNKLTVDITNPGTAEWHIQLKKSGITLEQGKTYAICCNVSSTAARKIKMACMKPEPGYDWYGGSTETIGAEKYIYSTFTVDNATANNIDFVISMGSPVDEENQSASTIEIWNFELLKVD